MSRHDTIYIVLTICQVLAVIFLGIVWVIGEWRGPVHTALSWTVIAICFVQLSNQLYRGARRRP